MAYLVHLALTRNGTNAAGKPNPVPFDDEKFLTVKSQCKKNSKTLKINTSLHIKPMEESVISKFQYKGLLQVVKLKARNLVEYVLGFFYQISYMMPFENKF